MRMNLPKQNNYDTAYSRAAEQLRRLDVREVCKRCGLTESPGGLLVPYLGGQCEVALPDVRFDPDELPLMEKILVLHYLIGTGGPDGTAGTHEDGVRAPGAGPAEGGAAREYVSYKNLPGAAFYYQPYRKRGTARILKTFGNRPHDVVAASSVLGGVGHDMGDVSVRFRVFPMIDAVLVLYRGDDEFPPEAEILYRHDVARYLSLEDVAVVSGILASRLIKRRAVPSKEL